MSIAAGTLVISLVFPVSGEGSSSSGIARWVWCTTSSCEYAALSREGAKGVCGVCGDIGLPGLDEVDTEVAGTIGGTDESWRDDELDERWSICEDEMDSERAALESRILWNRFRAAVVLLVDASAAAASWGVSRSFFRSSILRKSEMFSSSSCIDPELPPLFASAISPDPGCCAEDVPLTLPLLFWSSSILVVFPPLDSRARR